VSRRLGGVHSQDQENEKVTEELSFNPSVTFFERVTKKPTVTPANTVHFHYDQRGQIIGVTSNSGGIQREYIWLDDMPVTTLAGTVAATQIYYMHNNHLNQPRGQVLHFSCPVALLRELLESAFATGCGGIIQGEEKNHGQTAAFGVCRCAVSRYIAR